MLQLMKPAPTTPAVPEVGDGTGVGTSRRGDATYAQTDYLSHKSVMSMNASSELDAKYNNGGEASSTQDCLQQDQKPAVKHGLSGVGATTSSPAAATATQQHQQPQPQPQQQHQQRFYFDQTHLATSRTQGLTAQPPPSLPLEHDTRTVSQSQSSEGQGQADADGTSGEYISPMTGLKNVDGYDPSGQGERRSNQVHPEVSRDLAARKEQLQSSGGYYGYTAEAGQKDIYSYGGEAGKSYPLTVPQYGLHKDRSESSFGSMPSCPPSYIPNIPKQPMQRSDDAIGSRNGDPTTSTTGGSKPSYDPFRKSTNSSELPVDALDIKQEEDKEMDVVRQQTTIEQTVSPAKHGDEAPATHSDSGIVHDGGSNTSSNSGSSGDHEDSATGSKAQSPPVGYPYDRRGTPPASTGELNNKTSGALSSPFMTAAITGASSAARVTSPAASSMAEMKERLAGSDLSLHFPPMPTFSHSPSIPSIPRPNMTHSNPLGLPFLPTGGGPNMSGNMTPPRAPLTPGSARSMSPPEIPPVIEGGKEVYFCHLCSYVGNSKFHFNQHMNSHFEHRCPHCDYTSRTEGRLKRHIKDFHSEVPPDNYSGTRTQRNVAPRPKVYKCKQCEFSSVTKIDFWEHSRSHIKDDKVLQCPKCPFVTEYKHHLEYHLRNHFGSKPFKCPKCNYACVNKSMLNSHMKSHTNVYQYRCSDCTYATKYCHSLKLHLKKYNHKPATVLNPDGSLPTDGSGDFELVSKRGPPRGPRGPRKDQQGSPQTMVNPMMMPQMPGMNGLHPASMMPGYWPMMPPMPNGTMHPPPPLIPASGAHLSPFNPGLPSHSQISHFPLDRERLDSSDVGGTSGSRSSGNEDGHTSGGEHTTTQPQFIKCVLCDFKAEQRASLNEHMIKVHGAENQDLLNVFCVQPDSLTEDQSRGAKNNSDGSNQPELSETAATPIKQEDTSSNSQSSPPPANQAWIMNTSQPSARKSTPGEAFPSPMFRSTPQGMPTPHHMDMMQHHLLKERYNAAIAAEIAQNIEAEAKQNGESPLDLTKRKEQFQQQLAAHQMFFNPGFMLPQFQNLQKRKFEEISGMVAMAAAAAGSQEHGRSPPPSDASMTPRKRSRKGKAYKLDTICQKLQERYGDSPSPGNDSFDGETSDSAMTGNNMHSQEGPQSAAPSGGDENEEQIDYSAIHRSLSELNNQMAVDPYQAASQDGRSKQLTEVEEGKGSHEGISPSASSSSLHTTTVNRRKLFMVRHHEQLQQQARESNGDSSSSRQSKDYSEDASISRDNGSPSDGQSSTPPYECSHCAISFRDCIMYTVHMGYHGYQDPFKCNMCGHASKNRVEFFLHIARAAHE